MIARTLIITDRLSSYREFQQSLRHLAEPDVWLIEARDLRFFGHESYAQQPELVLLDVVAGVTRSLAATLRVRALFPNAKIAVRAMRAWSNFAHLAVQAGAHGVIDASTYDSEKDMWLLIESVLAGNLIYRNCDDQ
ncbi:hypothetical protein [Achromobacter aegrifaciens]|uniref:Response regulatory domain-containing protein n=1 Tax=Achromobacter aegrifaciens TaxID=1287736 RepID=A0ABU2DJI6_ACHAE|nr:hypothetical protein [Achromobacter aegrifaciens]MDR7948293.1 hypothetical protein [Achromobacter aegrifaciens]